MSIPRGLHDNSVRPVHQNRERKSVPLSPKWFAATEIEMEKSMRANKLGKWTEAFAPRFPLLPRRRIGGAQAWAGSEVPCRGPLDCHGEIVAFFFDGESQFGCLIPFELRGDDRAWDDAAFHPVGRVALWTHQYAMLAGHGPVTFFEGRQFKSPLEQNRLFELLHTTHAGGVLFVC